ncbi:hypothetical protein AV274_2346 [Blastocystis sp. ATCC 50177/Nand II]|uniref:Elongin-C n=1 Tax=Blastocystis sp. subtype 1 (strain ATCC 50177 / NandII) TaxID=478820 RepID=A0A196SID2_BLAHN|nr:hypothetical protein AV274_2346 [Blastocystis sp. ATCC 50177/Nand II]
MSGTITFITSDKKRIVAPTDLILEMSKAIRSLWSLNERKDGVEESETTEMELEDISSGTLEIVLSYMKLKREKGNLQITDLHIDETKILDVMAAALFFDC